MRVRSTRLVKVTGPSRYLLAALNYAKRNWAVFPIIPGQKRPATLHGLNDATTDSDLIEAWWTRWPHHGIGIATGDISGIFVIDIDVAGGKMGFESWERLKVEFGDIVGPGWIVGTPSGGAAF